MLERRNPYGINRGYCNVVSEHSRVYLGQIISPIYVVAVMDRITFSSNPWSTSSSTRSKHVAAMDALVPLTLLFFSPRNEMNVYAIDRPSMSP